jgi:HPt (histidine-containing phosphotransfer) domain-containing protein
VAVAVFFCVYGFFGLLKERKIMTVKECYSQMGGDYNNVLSRFYDEAMIKRLLGRFIDHTSFRALEQAMTEGDTQAAFNAAHTLRGVCQSLSFTQLCGTLDSITEALRGGNIAAAAADMDKAKREYDVTLSAIRTCMEN